eukprot:scaffold7115_cov125-Isochrysis_galbana.AAC.11
MEQYAAEQLALFATNNPLYYYEGENKIHIKIESRKILDDANNRRNATSSSNNNSIPRQLIESSLLHIIVRVYSPAEYVQIRLKYLANAFGDQLEFVKGNQQKNKVRDHASNEFVTVKSKAPIWHLYLSPKVGKLLRGMIFPGFIEIDTPSGKIRLKYIIRPNSELMENDKMIICEGACITPGRRCVRSGMNAERVNCRENFSLTACWLVVGEFSVFSPIFRGRLEEEAGGYTGTRVHQSLRDCNAARALACWLDCGLPEDNAQCMRTSAHSSSSSIQLQQQATSKTAGAGAMRRVLRVLTARAAVASRASVVTPGNSRKSQLGRGVRLLGFWALGRHAAPEKALQKKKDKSKNRACCALGASEIVQPQPHRHLARAYRPHG